MVQDYPHEPVPAVYADVPGSASGAAPAHTIAPRTTGPVRGRVRRGPLAWIADSRGLTFLGAALLATAVGTAGGLFGSDDTLWVGTFFTIMFAAGCVVSACLAHREDLLLLAFLPPLSFIVVAVIVGITHAVEKKQSLKSQAGVEVASALSFGAPALWIATGATAVIVLVRFLIVRLSDRSAAARAGRATTPPPSAV